MQDGGPINSLTRRSATTRWSVLPLLVVISWPIAAAEPPPQILSQIGITPQLGVQVPLQTAFTDHRGQSIRLDDLVGDRPVVLCLVYYRCPMLCGLTADGLLRTLQAMPQQVGRDLDVMMISFDARDGPSQAAEARRSALARYDRQGAERGWHALTGDANAISALTTAVGFRYRWDDELQQYAHAAGLIVLTRDGRVAGYLDGVRFSPQELASVLRRADSGSIAATAPSGFLRCYLYDPTTGRLGAAVQWTVRGLGALTVVGLAVGISVLVRRERQAIAGTSGE